MSLDWVTLLQSLSWDAAMKITLAAVLGAIVGLERMWGGRPAGLRTNMMIAISSCLFTFLSIEAFPSEGSARDTARVAAQIVTGVGFLGAGVVLQTRKYVRGLTTAATIWLVAAIGMAVGTGAYFVAIFTTILSTVSLILLAPISERLEQRAHEREEEEAAQRKRAARMDKEDGDKERKVKD
ncbi:MAG: MgtC/SapB family protein [Anaerolineales bacterium]|nr:MgtC/SapB family protein [Anaerolineales bacterium]